MKKFLKNSILSLIVLTSSFCVLTTSKLNVSATENTPNCKSSYLMDYNSKTVISAYNENERLPIASMTKIMLLLLSYESVEKGNLSLDESIIVSENASSMGGSQVFLENGGEYKVCDLLKAITVSSANDASVAIAERLYGSEEECVKAMNDKVECLNLKNTQFSNCTGLPKPMQYSSAKDISLIFSELLRYNNYFDNSTIWMDSIAHKNNSTELTNTNKLIKYYEGCDGGKTGFTREAGFCLTATAKRGNMRLISCCIGANDSKERFKIVSDNFNYGFNNYSNKMVVDKTMPIECDVKVKGTNQKNIEVYPKDNFYIFTKRNEKQDVNIEYNISVLKAPLNKGQSVGYITVFNNGVECAKIDVIVNCDVKKANYFEYIKQIANKWSD